MLARLSGLVFNISATQGIQHYKPIYGEDRFAALKRNDKRKRMTCLRRGVLLTCVPHWKKNPKAFILQKLISAGFLA